MAGILGVGAGDPWDASLKAFGDAPLGDGSMLWKPLDNKPESHTMVDWTPDEIRDLRRQAGRDNWTIAVGGRERRADWAAERDLIASLEIAGATAWQEWLAPAERASMQAAIQRGPL